MDDLARDYLRMLDVTAARPTLDLLERIHRAHAARFPHDTIWMVRGRVPEVDTRVFAECLVAGEGGACMQLNGGLHWLLTELGFAPRLHSATAQATFQQEADLVPGDHMVLTVRLPEGTFLVDCGTGTGHSAPLPLVPGSYEQGGLTYEMHREDQGWWVRHDRRPRGLRGVRVEDREADLQEFAPLYHRLATDPTSPYLRMPWAQRRTPTAVERLQMRTLRVRTPAGWEHRDVDTPEEWLAEMTGRFGLGLPGLTADELERVWALTTSET